MLIKIKRKIWGILVSKSRNKQVYPFLYRSYWNYLLKNKSENKLDYSSFFSSIPNPGAGIGHQIANWIAGYWFAQQFDVQFAHMPFSNQKWEDFLGFGEDEKSVKDLVNKNGYKKVTIPLFRENDENEISRIKNIINSYRNQKVIFICEQDQFYKDQFRVMGDIKKKFYLASERENDILIYDQKRFNVAIHVRRGDIFEWQKSQDSNENIRWQNNDYFKNVLELVIKNIQTEKSIALYLFSQGERKDFSEFEKFPNLHYCLDMNAQDSFLHMVFADLLITSKSSFSYKPALLSNGIKISPEDFWHGYPNVKDWLLASKDGDFEIEYLQ